jgi:hypothetical protein
LENDTLKTSTSQKESCRMDPFSQLRRSYDTEMLIFRSLFALNPDTNLPISTNFIVSTDGIGGLVWMDPFQNLSTAGPGVGYLPSTLFSLTSNVSSLSSLTSTINIQYQAGLSSLSTVLGLAYISSGIYIDNLTSTVEGLGSSEYVSTASLVSTTSYFLDPSRYVSTGALVSTTAGLLPNINVLSTVTGLGSIGYISSSQLLSTVQGLASIGYISSTQFLSALSGVSTTTWSTLQSTVEGLGSAGYISSSQLVSSVSGLITNLGSFNYVSSSQLVSSMNTIFAESNYVSTGALVSTAAGLSTNFAAAIFIDNAGNITINGGNISFSSVASVVYLSSFVFSSINYQGITGTTTAFTYNGSPPRSMLFSTATIPFDSFSSLITPNSRVYLDYYPTFVFSGIYQGASAYLMRGMSSFLQYGNSYLTENQVASWVYGNTTSNAFGNLYQQPMRLQIPGNVLNNNYENPYVFCHNLVSSLTFDTTSGFKNCNIDVQVGATNSVFLSIQNLG